MEINVEKKNEKPKREMPSLVELIIILAIIVIFFTITVEGVKSTMQKNAYQKEFMAITHQTVDGNAWKHRKGIDSDTYQLTQHTKSGKTYRVTVQKGAIIKLGEKTKDGYETTFIKP